LIRYSRIAAKQELRLVPRKKYVLVMLLALVVLQSVALPVFAADMEKLNQELDNQQQQGLDQPNLILEFLKLLFVLALIVAAAWSVIKIFSQQVSSRMQGTWLHVVDEVTLGQNKGIILCEVGERIFAIGITDHNISLLFEITHPKLLEEISLEMENKSANLPALSVPSAHLVVLRKHDIQFADRSLAGADLDRLLQNAQRQRIVRFGKAVRQEEE